MHFQVWAARRENHLAEEGVRRAARAPAHDDGRAHDHGPGGPGAGEGLARWMGTEIYGDDAEALASKRCGTCLSQLCQCTSVWMHGFVVFL